MNILLLWLPCSLLILVNLLIIHCAKGCAEKWISSGLVMLLASIPILFVLSFFVVGYLYNDAVAGGMAAIIYSFILERSNFAY